jgi:hypothetical protein
MRSVSASASRNRRSSQRRVSDRREEVKRLFNTDPDTEPLRILISTDAAREGINLQTYCSDLGPVPAQFLDEPRPSAQLDEAPLPDQFLY